MRKSVLFFLACIGLVILSVLTAYVVLFEPSIKDIRGAQVKAFNPEDTLANTENGREILRIRKLLDASPKDAQAEMVAFDKNSKATLTPTENAYRLFTLRSIASDKNEPEVANEYTQKLYQLAETEDLPWLTLVMMIDKSTNLARKGEIQDATKLINEAIKYGTERHILYLLPKAHNTAGFLSNADNQLMDAQRHFLLGIQVSKRIGDDKLLGTFYNNLGLLYLHIEKWDKALDFMEKARKAPTPPGRDLNSLHQVIHLNEAYIYYQLNNLEKLRESFEAASRYYDEKTSRPRHNILQIKGETLLYIANKQYDKTIEAAERCLDAPKIFELPIQQGQCQLIKSKALLEQNQYQKALYGVEDSIATFSSINHKRWLIKAYEQKADILEALGDTDRALTMYKQYYKQDKAHLLSQVYDLEHAFVTQHIRQEKELLNIENKLAAAQLAKEKLRFQIACTWILIAAITIIYAFRKTSHVQNKNAELQNLSFVDELTTLHNRRYYTQQLETCQEIDGEIGYRIALFDLDNFKSVNDTYGHDVGDEVLVETASRLKELVSNTEMLIRWGGEEFLVLMRDDEHIGTRVDAMLDAIGLTAFSTQAGPLNITASIGVSPVALPASLAQDDGFFRKADQNLYEAKRSGKNRAIFPN
ncbi:tetratricopeptide repeat-containing diguanylate cyclase [Vibrio nigripulchritudo]|uniref:tetratricopeptide repeat-containing diguanylate cyclase n=1 Tax=Vibrio nigripulchritudo TaxID=28173 RepID=UPI0005FA1220|nr:GGDEF domain-containing protein [Vibrio nigripulchritudo]KJY79798.1 hypothetical protein TW74_08410 [Vibrio nigripulchritudo]